MRRTRSISLLAIKLCLLYIMFIYVGRLSGPTFILEPVCIKSPLCLKLSKNLGANINAQNGMGSTPMIIAIFRGNTDSVLILLELGADPNLADQSGTTPLLFAVQMKNLIMMEALLKAGANPDTGEINQDRPLMAAARSGDLASVILLHKYRASLNDQDKFGLTALMDAASLGHLPIVEYLVSNGANPALKSQDQLSAIQLASLNARTEVVNYLKLKTGSK